MSSCLLLLQEWVPIRPKGDAAFWAAPVPGDNPSLVWQRVHPYGDLPKVTDPLAGWVQNSNSAPWYMTMPFLDPSDYPAYMSFPPSSPEGALSDREASGLRMLMQMKKISLDTLVEDKYSTRSELAERVLDDLIAAGEQYGSELGRHAAEVLQKWDRKADAESRGAALFAQWKMEMDKGVGSIPYAQPFDWKQPLRTPHGLKDPKTAAAALDTAAEKLQSMVGRLDVPWGDLYRLRRGSVDLPGNGGGEGLLGTFRIIDYSQATDGRFQSDGGDSFIAAIEFGPTTHAKVLLTYGNSSDPKSTHFGDQLVLSPSHRIVEVLRCLHTLRRQTNHALSAATPLRRGIAHPRFKQTFCLQAIYGRIKCSNGAFSSGCCFNLFPNRCAIGLVSKSGSRCNQ
jgi:acyl-homoserine-lactone acylase